MKQTTFKSFKDYAESLNVKEKTPNKQKYEAQKEKFFKCRKCGGTMKLVAGNVMICDNEIKDKEGNPLKTKKGEQVFCTNRRFLDEKDASYAEYLLKF